MSTATKDSYDALVEIVTSPNSDYDTIAHAIRTADSSDVSMLIANYDTQDAFVLSKNLMLSKTEVIAIANSTATPQPSAPSANSAVNKTEPAPFPLSRIDGSALDLQQRAAGYDSEHIDDLKAAIEDGTELTPIDLYIDAETGTAYIGDGWHRYIAHHLLNKKQIPARLHEGGKEAAFLASLSANAKQLAKPRRRADLRKAVIAALGKFYYVDLLQCNKLPKSQRKTLEQIAELCSAGNKSTISRIAKDLEAAATPKTSPSSADSAVNKTEQIDFFAQLNASFKPVEDGLKEVLNHSYFLNPDVLKKDKIEALETIEHSLKAKIQEAKDLKTKLAAQEESAEPQQS
jgi:hypothetical protein